MVTTRSSKKRPLNLILQEIVLSIVDFLPERKDVLNLGTTCRQLYLLLEPQLFKTVVFRYHHLTGGLNEGLVKKFLKSPISDAKQCYVRSLVLNTDRKDITWYHSAACPQVNPEVGPVLQAFPMNSLTSFRCSRPGIIKLDVSLFSQFLNSQKESLRWIELCCQPKGSPDVWAMTPVDGIMLWLSQFSAEWVLLVDAIRILKRLETFHFYGDASKSQNIDDLLAAYRAATVQNGLEELFLAQLRGPLIPPAQLGTWVQHFRQHAQSDLVAQSPPLHSTLFFSSITRLEIFDCREIQLFFSVLNPEHFRLKRFKVNISALEDCNAVFQFVKSLSRLEEMYISFGYIRPESNGTSATFSGAIQGMLKPHRKTLKCLGIHYDSRVAELDEEGAAFPMNGDPDHSEDVLAEYPLLMEICYHRKLSLEDPMRDLQPPQIKAHPSLEAIYLSIKYGLEVFRTPGRGTTARGLHMDSYIWDLCLYMGENATSSPKLSVVVVREGYRNLKAWSVHWEKKQGANGYEPLIDRIIPPVYKWLRGKGYSLKCLFTNIASYAENPWRDLNFHG